MESLTLQQLREKANSLPLTPGVYIMLDENGEVIYVGKAKKLKNRVTSYFTGEHLPKVAAMVEKVADFNFILVDTEFDALMLENSLIKRYMPHYNILLKDDKGYPMVRLSSDELYPKFKVVSRRSDDNARYFGPYGGRGDTREIIREVSRALGLPDCSRCFPRDIGKERPCLHYHTGDCEGWCLEGRDSADYNTRIEQAALILDGRSSELIADLKEKMLEAADNLRFEYAAVLRNRIRAIESIANGENLLTADISVSGAPKISKASLKKTSGKDFRRVSESGMRARSIELLRRMLCLENAPSRIEAFDISNLGSTGIVAGMTVFVDGRPKKSEYRRFRIRGLSAPDDYASMRQAVERRFLHAVAGDDKFSELPDILLIDGGANHAAAAAQVLVDLGISLPVFGAVKDDRHRTRALVTPDGNEIGINGNQAVFSLIGRIQEETHRYAIEYQRSTRAENKVSELDRIPGIGPKRRNLLMKHFKSLKAIRQAGIDELRELLPENAANAVWEHFHKD